MDLKKHIKELKNVAEVLSQYNYPKRPKCFEEDLTCLRQRYLTVNGYNVSISLLKEDHGDVFIYVLQVYSTNFPVLPFDFLLKRIVVEFLGDKGLLLNEFWIGDKKIYNWSVSIGAESKEPIISFSDKAEKHKYDDIEYYTLPNIQKIPHS